MGSLGKVAGLTGNVIAGTAKIAAVGSAAIAAGLGVVATKGVQLASDLEESQNVVDVTFRANAEHINNFAKNAADAFGLSELEGKQFTGTMGAMLKSMKVVDSDVLKMSQDLVGLAGDIGSFYNIDAETAFAKIRSGISGETEPLKQLGINMSVANLEAYAMTQGINKSMKKMTQAEQAALRYSYIMSVTADAQGDFARTSDSLANQQKLLKLNFESLMATATSTLMPVLAKGAKIANDFMRSLMVDPSKLKGLQDFLVNIADTASKLIPSVTGLIKGLFQGDTFEMRASSTSILNMLGFDSKSVSKLSAGIVKTAGQVRGFFENIQKTALRVAPNVQKLIAGIFTGDDIDIKLSSYDIVRDLGFDRDTAVRVSDIITNVSKSIRDLIPVVGEVASTLAPILGNAFLGMGEFLSPIIDTVKEIAPVISNVFEKLAPPIGNLVNTILPPLLDMISQLAPVLEVVAGVVGPLIDVLSTVLSPILAILSETLLPVIISAIQLWGTEMDRLVPAIQFLVDALDVGLTGFMETILIPFSENIQGVFNGISEFLTNTFAGDWSAAWENIKSIFSNAFSAMETLAKLSINSIIDSINGAFEALKAATGVSVIEGLTGISIPGIPKLADGATLNQPTLAWVAEAGYPETVVPHKNTPRSRGLLSEAAAGVGLNLGGSSSESFIYSPSNVYHIYSDNPDEIKQAIKKTEDDSIMEFERFFKDRKRVSYAPQ